MKPGLVSPRFFPRLTVGAFALATVTAFAACSADGDLQLGPNDDAGPPDAGADRAVPSFDAGTDAPEPKNPLCGNRKTDLGEECDDGNLVSNDGCSATCKLESAGPNDVCGGVTIALVHHDASTLHTGRITGTTSGLFNHYSSTCGGGSGPDAVYRIDPPMTGRATIRVTSSFSSVVSVRTNCTDSKTELGCADDSSGTAGSEVAVPVYQGAPVFVFVDGYGGSGGDFTLDVEVQTAVCGNGKAEFPEDCDDGNTTGNDGCSETCTLEDTTTKSACPGMAYRLVATAGVPGKASFAGDTSLLAHGGGNALGCTSASGTTNSGAGRNAVYAITPTISGNLSLDLLANYPNALLHVRRECIGTENDAQVDCSGSTNALVPLKTSIPVVAERTVYVFVDSANTSSDGLYTLDATLTASECGNGLLDNGEECDDGNTNDGDGCSATCTVLRDPSTYTCPGKPLRLEGAVVGPRSISVRGTTAPLPGETVPASKSKACGADKAPDVVYQMTSDIDGWAIARVKGVFNTTLSARTTCTLTTTSEPYCAKAVGGSGEEVLAFPVNKETPYFLVVDGATEGQQGSFKLDVEITPSVCGNLVVEGGETCDDGATASGDGCDDKCLLEPASPHDTCASAPLTTLEARANGNYGATIVSGNTNMTKPASPTHSMSPCSSLWADGWYPFTAPISGVVTARVAAATFRSTIGVRTGCAPSGTQRTCDDTNQKGGQEITFAVDQGTTYWIGIAGGLVVSGKPEIGTFTLDVNLVPVGCGDTFLNPPEQCDDGNVVDGDGCSSTCTLETFPNAQSCPGHTVALTGVGAETRRATVTIDTTGYPNNSAGICGGSGPEGILVITPDIDGTLAIKSTASHALMLHTRTTCSDPTTEIPSASCGTGARSVNITVQKNTPYYVYVDGLNNAAGMTKLQITVTP
jgi:cysteine-rich repeat protein